MLITRKKKWLKYNVVILFIINDSNFKIRIIIEYKYLPIF